MRMRPDEDGSSSFSRVTGEQPLVPHVLPANFDLTELSIALHKLPFDYKPPRKRVIDTHMPKKLQMAKHVWLRTDRVKRPLESPYQDPFLKLQQKDNTVTIEQRGKPVVVSIDRVKPAVLPAVDTFEQSKACSTKCEKIPDESECQPTRTTSGRKVQMKKDPDYIYC